MRLSNDHRSQALAAEGVDHAQDWKRRASARVSDMKSSDQLWLGRLFARGAWDEPEP